MRYIPVVFSRLIVARITEKIVGTRSLVGPSSRERLRSRLAYVNYVCACIRTVITTRSRTPTNLYHYR